MSLRAMADRLEPLVEEEEEEEDEEAVDVLALLQSRLEEDSARARFSWLQETRVEAASAESAVGVLSVHLLIRPALF